MNATEPPIDATGTVSISQPKPDEPVTSWNSLREAAPAEKYYVLAVTAAGELIRVPVTHL